jgi:putative restriction endonuclease
VASERFDLAPGVTMKTWWVNHKQTQRQEIGGGYLWSPKAEANGNKSHFYDNMRIARPGDVVLSYANGKIDYVGFVSDDAISAPKPQEFGTTGEYWSDEGWELPVTWTRLPNSFVPKAHLDSVRRYLPAKYSPLNDQGNGNQKAYLAEIPLELFEYIIVRVGPDIKVAGSSPEPRFDSIEADLDNVAERSIRADVSLSETEKEQICSARRGQGEFRKNVSLLESSCRVTGVETLSLLIASHIKPWRSCSTAQERLDGNNGLLLTPTVDKLFDRGYISFSSDGDLLISPRLATVDINRLGLNQAIKSKPLTLKQTHYLEYHRTTVFLP